jgi:cupin fold WbuC family metalloprotein
MTELLRRSAEVYVAAGPIAMIGPEEILFLKTALVESGRGRVRVNLHSSDEDGLHEMFIAINPGSYIRPHRHRGKSEAFHLVHGAVDIIVFDEGGEIDNIVQLSAAGPGAFYYRLSEPLYHTVVVRSEILVFHEITNGPFRPEQSDLAAFAPDERNAEAARSYVTELHRRIDAFLAEQR